MIYDAHDRGRERGRDNWDSTVGSGAGWNQMKGKVKEQWGKLTDDELDQIEGRRDQLIGKVQKAYGVTEEEAERQVDQFMTTNREYLNRGRDPNMH